MKNKNATITYDKEADVLAVENDTRTPIQYAEEMGNLVVHFSKKGQPVLVEILEASKLFKHQTKAAQKIIRQALVAA